MKNMEIIKINIYRLLYFLRYSVYIIFTGYLILDTIIKSLLFYNNLGFLFMSTKLSKDRI